MSYRFMMTRVIRALWRHQMETFSALLAICAGNSPVPGEFPTQRPVTRRFDVFFDLRLNKRLSKQSWGWWLETLSRPLWRHRNGFGCIFRLSFHSPSALFDQRPLWCTGLSCRGQSNYLLLQIKHDMKIGARMWSITASVKDVLNSKARFSNNCVI